MIKIGVKYLGANVFDSAIDRVVQVYEMGHRIVVSVSGGKDSCCAMEVTLIAAQMTDNLPVDIIHREEEIIYPGTREYLMRVAERDEVNMHWMVAHQPTVNAFNREHPYWWVMDPTLEPSQWVTEPPPYAYDIPDLEIGGMVRPSRFPPPPGKELINVVALRVRESNTRRAGLFSAGGALCGPFANPNTDLARGLRPIYDWEDGDIWKAIHDNGWDYNDAYDVMHRKGIERSRLRIGPPSMNPASIGHLPMASQAWPYWWDKVCARLPGIRAAAQFGKRVVEPFHHVGETWEQTYQRECIDQAPNWIAERSSIVRDLVLEGHAKHSTQPLPELDRCRLCPTFGTNWKKMAQIMYLGDPISQKTPLPFLEPEEMRPGAGYWWGREPRHLKAKREALAQV